MKLHFAEGTASDSPDTLYHRFVKVLQRYHIWSTSKHLVLLAILVVYCFVGAAMFQAIEKPAQDARFVEAKKEAARKRLVVVEQLVELAETCSNDTAIDCRNATLALIEAYDDANADNDPRNIWTFWNAFYYSGTIYTTIGFGNIACSTRLGQGLTILYALIGIPLMLTGLKFMGQILFAKASVAWRHVRRKIRHMVRYYKENAPHRKKLSFVRRDSVDITESLDDMELNFPLPLAFAIVFLYMVIVAGLIKWRNKQWDYFTAFYYFFISLSTIGLGDKTEVPEGNNYIFSFVYTVIGLALVSMCINIMQSRMERTYSAALANMETLFQLSEQLFEEEDEHVATPIKDHPDWALFRASQTLTGLQMTRKISRPAYVSQNSYARPSVANFRPSIANMRRNSRLLLDQLNTQNPMQLRQSLAAIHAGIQQHRQSVFQLERPPSGRYRRHSKLYSSGRSNGSEIQELKVDAEVARKLSRYARRPSVKFADVISDLYERDEEADYNKDSALDAIE